MTHDYKRNGMTDLFAALNVATGEVIYDTKKKHTSADVLNFFQADRPARAERARDPCRARQPLGTQGAARGQVACPQEARTLASPLHADVFLVAQPRRRVVRSPHRAQAAARDIQPVAPLEEAIELWAEHWNDDPKPFVWRKTAEEIVAKVRRGRLALASVKNATDH